MVSLPRSLFRSRPEWADAGSVRAAPGRTVPAWMPMVVASGATFLAFLDVTITNLAVPALADDYRSASVSDLSWVVTAYAVVFAALLAPGGRWADVVGRRRLYLVGVTTFTAASLACALAPTLGTLLAARAVQAAGAAAMMPASLAIVLADVPAERRAAAIGKWSAAGAFAAAVGPALGGMLVDAFDWPALFLVNVPFGVLLALMAVRLPTGSASPRATGIPDPVGTVVLALGVGSMAVGISQAPTWGWTSAATVACLVVGVVGLAAAYVRGRRHPVPALETDLWSIRSYALTNLTSMCYGAALYSWLLVGVLVLTRSWEYSELRAGFAMTPGALSATVVAIAVGRRRSPAAIRSAAVGGCLVLAATGILTSAFLPDDPAFLAFWLPVGIIGGAAMGAVSTATSSSAALAVPPTRFATATGLNLTARQVGGALGVATMAAILDSAGPAAPGSGDGFPPVYVFCAAACAAAALAAWWIAPE